MLTTIGALAFLFIFAAAFFCLGTPWNKSEPVDRPSALPSTLDESDRAWLRWHFTLAGQRLSQMQCKHDGPDVIESGGTLLCPECREPIHDRLPILLGVSSVEALEVAERVRFVLAHQGHRERGSIVISCPGCRTDNA